MKVLLESSDIQAGLVIGHLEQSERWMVGRFGDAAQDEWLLVSLETGIVQRARTAAKLAQHLNDGELVPLHLFRARGAKGGEARAASLTPTQRTLIARKAVNARWKKKRPESSPNGKRRG